MSNTSPGETLPVRGRSGARPESPIPGSSNAKLETHVEVLDATPAHAIPERAPEQAIVGAPGDRQVQQRDNRVLRSALRTDEPPAAPTEIKYYRYVGEQPKQVAMPPQGGTPGYRTTIRPGKVLDTANYSSASLKTQGFTIRTEAFPRGNLEEISQDEARNLV